MKRKTIVSLVLVVAIMASVISIPAFANTSPTFKIQGKVVLPGKDVVTDNNLFVTLEYCSDRGTSDPNDDFKSSCVVILMKGAHEAPFSFDIPFSVTTSNRAPKFTLGYSVISDKYWERGYYTADGMQHYKENQMYFPEGSVSNLVITPIRASYISGKVSLPSYTNNKSEIQVSVIAKTDGVSDKSYDDFRAEQNIKIKDKDVNYSIKVPVVNSKPDYILMYEANADGYEKQGYYSKNGTVKKAESATKIDLSKGNVENINLSLIKKKADEKPPSSKYDLNKDGRVDVKDMVLIAQAMGSKKKYEKRLDLNNDGVINVKDLKIIQDQMKNTLKNKYKYCWFYRWNPKWKTNWFDDFWNHDFWNKNASDKKHQGNCSSKNKNSKSSIKNIAKGKGK